MSMVDGLVRHRDFQKILASFKAYYCKGADVCPKGENKYGEWVKSLGLDETKPYGRSKELLESFKWAKNMISLAKEDETNKYYKVLVGFPIESMNGYVYTEEELEQAVEGLIGCVPNLNHIPEYRLEDKEAGLKAETVGAHYEDGAAEALLRVPKALKCPDCSRGKTICQLIDEGGIVNVSLEAICKRAQGKKCLGMELETYALLTVDTLPGIPLARIFPVESLIIDRTPPEGAKMVVKAVVTMGKTAESVSPRHDTTPKAVEAMKEDELTKRMVDLRNAIDEASKPDTDPQLDHVKLDSLWAEYDACRDALKAMKMKKIMGEEEHVADVDYEAGDFKPDADWPDKCFAYVPDSDKKSDRKLPYAYPDGAISWPNVRNALARLPQTQGIPDPEKAKIRAKLQGLLRKNDPDYTPTENARSSLEKSELELRLFKAEQKSKSLDEQVLNAETRYKEALVKNADLEGDNRTLAKTVTTLEKRVEEKDRKELKTQKEFLEAQTAAEKSRADAKEQIQVVTASTREKIAEVERAAEKSVSEARAKVLEAENALNNIRLETRSEIQRIQVESKARIDAAEKSIGETSLSRDAYKEQMEKQKARAEDLDKKYQDVLNANLELTKTVTGKNEALIKVEKEKTELNEALSKAKRLGKIIATA